MSETWVEAAKRWAREGAGDALRALSQLEVAGALPPDELRKVSMLRVAADLLLEDIAELWPYPVDGGGSPNG